MKMPTRNEVRLLALNEEGKENVEAVAKLLTNQKIKSTWVESADVLATTSFEEDVIYVADPTKGNEVEHLVRLGFSVIGPQCALTVLKHNILLKKDLKYPVYNLTMLGCLICFSNIEPKRRAELRNKVECMGGNVTGSLTQDVSHLVVKEVGSLKYFSAAHVGIPIMTVDWIEHLWKHGQSRYISAKDGKWEEFRCPIFLGCSVCVTGFSTTERNRIQKLVTKFGGIYSGAMKLDFTTHLLVHKPEGQKYAMANKFGVKVVSIDWVYKSVEKGSCQDHNKHPVKPTGSDVVSKPNSSTPERFDTHSKIPHLHDMSNISVMTVNETVAPSAGDISAISAIHAPQLAGAYFVDRLAQKTNKADLLSFPAIRSCDQILDGILVYVVGFTYKEEEKLHQLLSAAGATRCKDLTAVVTHVLVGATISLPQNTIASLQAAVSNPGRDLYVVSYKWLLDSLRKGEVLSEFDYWMNSVADKPVHDEESISANNNEQSTFIQPDRPTQIESRRRSSAEAAPNTTFPAMQDVLSQYMNGGTEGDTSLLRNFDMNEENEPQAAAVEHEDNGTALNEAEEPSMDASSSRWSFYRGLAFILFGFDEEETNRCVDNIEKLGGRILPSYSKKVADYAVVPVVGCQFDRTATNVVTDFWIDSCLNDGRLLEADFHPMSAPFLIRDDVFPLEGCVTCLSKYQEPERSHMVALMRELGAEYQDNVARKDLPPMRRTTHLVVLLPEGDKYVGCKKWGIPTVTAEWVFACARQGTRVPEADYVVDKLDENEESVTFVKPQSLPALNPATGVDVQVTRVADAVPVHVDGEAVDKLEFPPMPRPPSAVDHIRRRLEAKDKVRREQDALTPFKDKVLRLMDTPSKFLNVGSNLNVSFHLDEVFALLKTPIHERERMKKVMKKHPDTPLSDCVDRFLKEALSKLPDVDDDVVRNLEKIFDKHDSDEERMQEEIKTKDDVAENVANDMTSFENDAKSLRGVVLYVCKKLTKYRMDASGLVSELGGEFRWTYDAACTHFVFQGKSNDMNREFRTARSEGKLIVSPHWLAACKEAGTRVEESDFPHIYNPNKSIQIVPVSSQARSKRAIRSSVQSSQITRSTRSKTKSSSTEDGDVITNTKKDESPQRASQEARESLKKTLENIMSSTGKLKSATTRLSSGSRNGSFSSPTNLPPPRSTNQRPTMKMTSESEKPESSQDVHVMWDDPVGRAEMERLMREQNEKHTEQQDANPGDRAAPPRDEPQEPTTDPVANGDICHAEQESLPQDDNRLSQIIREGRVPSFLISSVTTEQKTDYANVIQELGGLYLDRDYFDVSCTHLVVKKPARNEKFLASLASGKWILHTSYIDACKDKGLFIKEDEHEYGNPLSSWSPSNDTEAALSAASYRWRRQLNEKRINSETTDGAFAGWKILLFVSQRHSPGFVRLLESGSGQVVARSIPYKGEVAELTHAIIDPNRLKEVSTEYIESLHESGVHCCVPEYIADYLMKDPIPKVEDSYLPMFKDKTGDEKINPRKKRKMNN